MSQKKIYAFVCPDNDGGILSMGDSPQNQIPLVMMSSDIAKEIIPNVRLIYGGHGKRVELREFTMSKLVEVVCDGRDLGEA